MIRIKLAVLLAERGMRQSDLAEVTGISPHVISRIARGDNKNVNLKHIGKICTALDCEISDIYEYVPVLNSETRTEAEILNEEISKTIGAIVDRHVKWRAHGKRAFREDDL